MKAYILTESDLKLLEIQWEATKQELWAKYGGPCDSGGKMQTTAIHEAMRKLNYTVYGWLSDTVRK